MITALPIIIFIFLEKAFSIKTKTNEYCYGLALEGGGTKGVYQAGAYQAFADYLSSEQMEYNVVSG